MTDYSDFVQSNVVASIVQSEQDDFEDMVARIVESSKNVDEATSRLADMISDIVWGVIIDLEEYEPIAYSLAYEGFLAMDYENSIAEDSERIIKAFMAEHGSRSVRSSKSVNCGKAPRKAPSKASSSCRSKTAPKSKSTRSKSKTKPGAPAKKGRC